MELSKFRKELKSLGFKVKVNSMSWGYHATITDMEGNKMPTIFTKTTLEYWKPVISFLKDLKEDVNKNGDKVYGLKL